MIKSTDESTELVLAVLEEVLLDHSLHPVLGGDRIPVPGGRFTGAGEWPRAPALTFRAEPGVVKAAAALVRGPEAFRPEQVPGSRRCRPSLS